MNWLTPPLTAALSTAPSDAAFGPGRQTVYEQEALLTVDPASLPAGDLWVADRQEGRVGELTEVLRSFSDYPDPFYIRSSRPFWLVSQRLLRLLHEHVPSGHRVSLNNHSTTLVINMSLSLAKTMAQSLAGLIEQFEKQTGQPVLTMQQASAATTAV